MENLNESVKECLEKLKDSKIAEEDFYINTSNLCDAIVTISSEISENIEDIEIDLNKGDNPKNLLDLARQHIFQIISISEVIKDRINDNDFVELQNLIYEYNEMQKTNK
ncbi:hypothetical protein [Parabacteroides sp. Marseille-P3160]|uniref:hypothetical protein n=1 Tax=Parabacteroides sp. Marseille-P3160 TaxID=1917887 RepID=UPI0009B95BFC|nr:hypothetical protein [Parabacteroides sp. Marseille-P3160]